TIERLTEIFRSTILVPCTACHYCMPCPAGVNIPRNLAIFNNMYAERSFIRRWQNKRSYRALAGSEKKLTAERTNGKATLCTNCGACIPKCPQSIHIPEELSKIDVLFRRIWPEKAQAGKQNLSASSI
ncbi:MAG: 4Fe-4S dicluster domain-containing protein, partial [Spirochaetales bacterium]|nr:4Fe-4S dicluster domain-containing protein [Spirochaetales bacterium]